MNHRYEKSTSKGHGTTGAQRTYERLSEVESAIRDRMDNIPHCTLKSTLTKRELTAALKHLKAANKVLATVQSREVVAFNARAEAAS